VTLDITNDLAVCSSIFIKISQNIPNKIVHVGYQASSEESLKTINDVLWDFSRVEKEYSYTDNTSLPQNVYGIHVFTR
jgi:hypothetical protein